MRRVLGHRLTPNHLPRRYLNSIYCCSSTFLSFPLSTSSSSLYLTSSPQLSTLSFSTLSRSSSSSNSHQELRKTNTNTDQPPGLCSSRNVQLSKANTSDTQWQIFKQSGNAVCRNCSTDLNNQAQMTANKISRLLSDPEHEITEEELISSIV